MKVNDVTLFSTFLIVKFIWTNFKRSCTNYLEEWSAKQSKKNKVELEWNWFKNFTKVPGVDIGR